MRDCLTNLHQNRITPYSYHTDEEQKRHQHYEATGSWTVFITLILEGTLVALHTPRFDNPVERRALAAIALTGMAAFIGFVAATIHVIIDARRNGKDRSRRSINIQQDEIELTSTDTKMGEDTGLVKKNRGDASICRIQNFRPVSLFYPPSPIKTWLWTAGVALVVFAIACMVNHDLFDKFSGNIPLASNGIFTNCTNTDTSMMNNTACVFDVSYMFGFIQTSILVPLALGGVATLFHYAGAEATKRCQDNDEPYEPLESNFQF